MEEDAKAIPSVPEDYEALHKAAETGALDEVERLIAAGVPSMLKLRDGHH